MMETLGERIRRAAEKVGGLEALAKATGVKRTTMFDYASGRTEPKVSTLVEIANTTACSISWIATGHNGVDVVITGDSEGGPPIFLEVKSDKMATNRRAIPVEPVRKLVRQIAETYWEQAPKSTKPSVFADHFLETFDFLIHRTDVNEDAISEVIQFGAQRLKKASEYE